MDQRQLPLPDKQRAYDVIQYRAKRRIWTDSNSLYQAVQNKSGYRRKNRAKRHVLEDRAVCSSEAGTNYHITACKKLGYYPARETYRLMQPIWLNLSPVRSLRLLRCHQTFRIATGAKRDRIGGLLVTRQRSLPGLPPINTH